MKAFLMHPDRDFDLQPPLPWNEPVLTQDLELNTLLGAMAAGNAFLLDVARAALFSSLDDPAAIRYRQDILNDCLKNPAVVREIYQIPIESVEKKQRAWLGILSHYPSGILSSSIEMLQMFVDLLKKLKAIADEHANQFESDGFRRFFAMIQQELGEDYFGRVENHLQELRFRDGVLLSVDLGKGTEGKNYLLCKTPRKNGRWVKRVLEKKSPVYSFKIHPRDDHGARALGDLKERGINRVANALAQSAEHIDRFFNMLRVELAFYIGGLNLFEQLAQLGESVAFPQPAAIHERQHSFQGLYDVCLALTMKQKVVGNDVNADGKDLVIITGANQGGKSTFLRSLGLAQLMMQCGLFVPAEAFTANVCKGVFTHYKRKEDASMKSGKLDEELSRMSQIVDQITLNSLMLFNESFAATNEREGSEIARQIVSALVERRVKVFFVTHQYEFAHGFYDQKLKNALFLRAERKADGGRTYKLFAGEPMQTSHGQDIYHKIFKKPH